MTRPEIDNIIDTLAQNPEAGVVVAGTGGCRTLRVGGRGKGKSGGYRVITFFTGPDLPVFLLTVFGKGEKANLTRAECNTLEGLTKMLLAEYRRKVVQAG